MSKMMRRLWIAAVVVILLLTACGEPERPAFSLETVPAYSSSPYVAVNDNVPYFTEDQKKDTKSWEEYADLDDLGRCGVTMACIGRDIMPTEERGAIGQVKPTGWQTVKYDFVDGKYLYNRCHLIGFQLTGENANEENLITGTRYMNVDGMLPFENMVADYVRETGNHVMYRVTPCFQDEELVARGVLMEAWSVEDNGEGICYCVYVYNVQPGVTIDYATGRNCLAGETIVTGPQTYILNTNSMKFHEVDCGQAASISDRNRQESVATREELIQQGYDPAGCCKP